ncbi:beta-ketoacyl synthase N-terminal-like domain-containing protein [Paenibacillus sp. M1]|uniref:Beta-ketoacyl synthase N-terminal-like domain-containing protein n=1 Tax=Paenibacillus haidiansis TaxID=1574488 RepID=A0ABU7VR22_9BACL
MTRVFITGESLLVGTERREASIASIPSGDYDLASKGIQTRSMDRVSILTLAAATSALEKAGGFKGVDSTDTGLALGTMYGPLDSIHNFDMVSLETGALSVNPALFPNTVMNSTACRTGIHLEIAGPLYTVSNGITSSLDAVGLAYEHIRHGFAVSMLAGGVDEQSYLQARIHKSRFPLVETCGFVVLKAADRFESDFEYVLAEITGFVSAGNDSEHEFPSSLFEKIGDWLRSSGMNSNEIGLVSVCSDSGISESVDWQNALCRNLNYSGPVETLMEDRMSASGIYQIVTALRAKDKLLANGRYHMILNVSVEQFSWLALDVSPQF